METDILSPGARVMLQQAPFSAFLDLIEVGYDEGEATWALARRFAVSEDEAHVVLDIVAADLGDERVARLVSDAYARRLDD